MILDIWLPTWLESESKGVHGTNSMTKDIYETQKKMTKVIHGTNNMTWVSVEEKATSNLESCFEHCWLINHKMFL